MSLQEVGKNIPKKIPRPEAILAISAHYEREDTSVTSNEKLKTIHDFYGFPQELYDQKYDCPGSKELITKVKDLVKDSNFDTKWVWIMGCGVYFLKCILMPKFL
jgi:4,5-DOPA dioxygenase extradiol